MSVLGIVLLVIFCVVALLLLFLVAIQSEDSVGLGGIFGGNADSVFGSNTAGVITKVTTVLAVLFMVLSIVVALLNKSSNDEIDKMLKQSVVTESVNEESNWLGGEEATSSEALDVGADESVDTAVEDSTELSEEENVGVNE